MREDKDTVAKLDQIQTLARQVDQLVAHGQMPDQATAESYETAVRDLEMSPVGQAYVVARSNFEKLMTEGEPADQRGHGEGSGQQHHHAGMSAPGSSSSSKAPKGSGKSTLRRPWPSGCGRMGSSRSSCGSRAAPGRPRSPGRRCSIRSTRWARWPSCSSTWPRGPTWSTVSSGRRSRPDGWCCRTASRCPPRRTRWRGGGWTRIWCVPATAAATQGLEPDLTLILDLPPEVGQARQIAAGKRLDRLDQESAEFHRRVVEYYLAAQGEGVRHLDGRLPPDRLLQAAWAEVRAAPGPFRAAVG